MKNLLRSIEWKEAALGLALLTLLAATASYSYLLFHTFAELFGIVIAFGVFMFAWNTRRFLKDDYLLCLGVASFFVAMLDLLHTMAFKGMLIFDGFDDNLPTQLWIASRYLQGASFLIAPLFFRRRLPLGPAMLACCALTTAVLLSLFHWRAFPDCFLPGEGLTDFKVVSEYVIGSMLAGGGLLLLRNRSRFDPLVLRHLVMAIGAAVVTELCFTAYKTPYAWMNFTGHVFKILSFYFLYRAIIETGLNKPHDLLFRDLQQEVRERRKVEESLRKSRELLSRTQKAGGVGGFEWDRESGAMAWTSQSFRLFDAPLDFAPSLERILERTVPEDRAPLREAFVDSAENGAQLDAVAKIATFTEHKRWIRFLGASLTREGRPVLTGVMQDVSDSKRLEILRDDIERMTRHDLKNPLNSIIGLPAVILSDKEMPREEIDEYLQLIRQTGYKMLDMVNINLDLFKMEQGTYEFEPEPVDFAAMLRRFGLEAAGKLRAREVGLEVLLDGAPAGERGRFVMLGQELPCWSMLWNLVENAIQASPKGGTVTVRMTRRNGSGSVSISNRGAVPEAIRPRFFEKYVTSGKSGGTGLGTYSAKLIAETMGGDISLDTSDPGGTTVTVTLPMAN